MFLEGPLALSSVIIVAAPRPRRRASCRSRREHRTFVCGWRRTGVRSWWTVADPADLAGFDFADRLASAKWVSSRGGFASTGHSPEGRTLQ
jgi:hypothetical protein